MYFWKILECIGWTWFYSNRSSALWPAKAYDGPKETDFGHYF